MRHLNFVQHECYLEVRVPRMRLPNGKVPPVEPEWVGRLDGFTLLFEALVLALAIWPRCDEESIKNHEQTHRIRNRRPRYRTI
jgi:hypothetical protein